MDDWQKYKILIVDDERTNILALSGILRRKYTVFAATSGQAALDAIKNNKPDLILLDVIMPDMSGFDVLVQLKSSGLTRDIPVIFITGLDNVEDERKGFFLGAVDYITKPFHDSIVEARVKTQLKIVDYVRTIERLGMIDALTNVPNRRSFDERLHREWRRAAREKSPISMLMLDVDNFKVYNDTYGHPQGDLLLHKVAEISRRTLKHSSDFIARWGGDEFVILLSNTDLNEALDVADQIRLNVERAVILLSDGGTANITVSVGVNTETPSPGQSFSDLMDGADKALYAAKNLSRNAVSAPPS